MYEDHASAVSDEVRRTLEQVESEQVKGLVDLILASRRIFVAGAGRSGLMVRAFAVRLMHMGFKVFVVGDVTTPAVGEGDVLLIGSGSGETRGLVLVAKEAAGCRARVGLLTAFPDSAISELASCVVRIPAPTPKSKQESPTRSIQPMGSLFEQCLLIVLDIVVLMLMKRKGLSADRMFEQHANLE